MQGWHTTFLGMRGLPRDISDFEMKAFFTFDGAERDAINARRGDSHKLGLALHIGFLRMSGRLLGAFRVIPVALWRHLGNELGIAAPEVASLRAMYERGRTLFDHQQVACTVLGFQWMSEHQRRSLVRELRDEVARCADRDQLLVRARQWLYKNKLVIVHERAIRTLIAAALAQLEVETGTAIAASVDPATLDRWRASVSELRPDGQTQQSWLWAAPAKHSTRQISEVLERIDLLYTLDVHKHLADIPDLILRRYARRLVSRPPSAGAKIKEPARTVEVACFLRYCLFTTTDQLILMVQRRIADLWRQAAADVPATVNWAAMYKTLLGELVALSAQGAVPDAELRARLEALITETQKRKPPSRASLVREGLIDGIRPVRSLLVAIAKLPWQATGEHPAIEYLAKLQALYLKGSRKLLNRGEAVNALKRAIYTGRISPAQAKRVDEMQAVADALSLMANIVMAWNTSQMQAVLDRWSNRRQVIPPELIGKIAPTRLESINLRGVFRFPVDRYADQILPSRPNASITGTNG